jgi:hypothetical protein|tara:strand:- start:2401 stop:2586 length:186 start_codon:yes stop_codon:yes gene_type:complete
MPKSRNRKNHKKKVAARNMRLVSEKKQMVKQLESMKEAYMKAKQEKEQEDTGEVPFTLGDK